MAWGIDEVQDIFFAVLSHITHPRGLEFDGDPPFPLQFHVVEELFFHIPLRHCLGVLEHPVCQGRFSVVDVGNDRKITNTRDRNVSHGRSTNF